MALAVNRGRGLTTAHTDWRDGALEVAIVAGVGLVAVTEGLSAVGRVTREPLALIWAACCGLLAVLVMRNRQPVLAAMRGGVPWFIVGIGALCLALGVVALTAPPNTSDSLAYHMSRVANWQQQHSVEHYSAGFLPQLFHPPLAEFAILNLQVLAGSDRFANLPQWLAMVGSLVVVSMLARMLGANPSGQVLTAVFAATLPVGILEATGTQNDYVATFWLACFVACVLRIQRASDATSWRLYHAAGAALGLALLAKAPNYIYVVPFGVLLTIVTLQRLTFRRVTMLASVGVLALLINVGYYTRNYELFGSPLGPGLDEGNNTTYLVDSITLNGFLSNVLRNLSLHFGTPDVDLNHTIYDDVIAIHRWFGISPNAPATTFGGDYPQSAVNLEMHDSRAGNLLALVVLVITLFAGAVSGRFGANRPLLVYATAWLASFLLFCLLLKWQLWNARLHLGWFVLGAPLVGVVWTRSLSPLVWRVVLATVAIALVLRASGGVQSSPRRALLLIVIASASVGVLVVVERRRGWWSQLRPALLHSYLASEKRIGELAWIGLALILLVAALPWVAFNEIRPLLGSGSVLVVPRTDQYFVNGPEKEAAYVWAADQVAARACDRVGLLVGPSVWDYPMWVLLRERLSNVAIRNVHVPNVSARLNGRTLPPCAVVGLWPVDGDQVRIDDQSFTRVSRPTALDSSDPTIAVFMPTQ